MKASADKYLKRELQTKAFLESLRSRQVIIYGGGKIGTRICRSLRSYGIEPAAIWDQKADLIGDVDGLPVTRPTPEDWPDRENTVVLVTVYAQNVCQAIEADLRARGMVDVRSKRALLNAILYLECHALQANGQYEFNYETCHLCPVSKDTQHRCDIYSESLAKLAGVPPEVVTHPTDNTFVIPSMGVLVTNHCNLTCDGCNHLRDHYQPADNVRLDTEQILADVRRVSDAVDLIERLVIVGGEAFVHHDLRTILERLLELPKVGVLQIITNGTVIPKSPELYAVLANPRIMIEISGYGSYLPQELQANVYKFISILREHGIHFQHLETLDWQDFGGFEHRGYDRKQHLRVYKTCCFVSNDLFDGKLFKCSRSVFATRLGKIPDYPGDYVDVRGTEPDELRAELSAFFLNQYPAVCQHCDGTSAKRMEAGKQVPREQRVQGTSVKTTNPPTWLITPPGGASSVESRFEV